MQKIIINLKPSAKIVSRFKGAFPNASFYGAVTLGSKSKSYLLPLDEYESRKDEIKQYGSKAKNQPFITNPL